MRSLLTLLSIICLQAALPISVAAQQDRVNFSRDIRPILSDTCFKCHGPDSEAREADLRLDSKENVFDHTEVVVPNDIEESELYQRLVSDDEDMLMPPPESGRTLTAEQIELIKRWIEQGADWGQHWSLETPTEPLIPAVEATAGLAHWSQTPIDRFLLHSMNRMALRPSPPADRATLARRVSLDLTGLPPTAAEVASFENDKDPKAYEKYVDRLLDSPQYAEHMTRHWLDVVRYGDTHGLHLDNYRENWAYRDWIIDAFKNNQPFDQFSIDQLAGDLLDKPSNEQLIATGFNRSHVTTAEGGSIKEEVRVRNVTDRVSTFGTVYLGLTVGCAACHDHKFDPISQKEFYSLYSYFNSLDADPMDGNNKAHAPVLMVGDEKQMTELKTLELKIAEVQKQISTKASEWKYTEPDDPPAVPGDPVEQIWIDDALPNAGKRTGEWKKTEGDFKPASRKVAFVHEAKGNQQYVLQGVDPAWLLSENDQLHVNVYLDPDNPPREIMIQWNDGSWEHRAFWGEDLVGYGQTGTASRWFMGPLPRPGKWHRLTIDIAEVNLTAGSKINGIAFTQFDGKVYWDAAGRTTRPLPFPANRSLADWLDKKVETKGGGLPGPLAEIVKADRKKWTDAQKKHLQDHFIENDYADSREVFVPLINQRDEATKREKALRAMIPTTLIYRETNSPRDTFLLNRGQYDQPTDKVTRTVPEALPDIPDGVANDRLALANWLFTKEQPLTARVTVNRFWQQVFGVGLVQTSEDFGAQGTFPTHPELLDYLAVDFRDNGWDVKRLMKMMVMAEAYKQNSSVTPELLKKDPTNKWFARGRRYRLDAEVLRDQALSVSGLLFDRIGGPSVKPPQPEGLWYIVGYTGSNTVRFKKDEGHEKVHRRSMYTFWKRTSPPPQMSTLDAPSREVCMVRRERTNTPLQALLLMNEPQFVEAARHLAKRTLSEAATDSDVARMHWMFATCLLRSPTEKETAILEKAVEGYLAEFNANPGAALDLLAIGELPEPKDSPHDKAELAAWTMVANLLMNMDEFLTKN